MKCQILHESRGRMRVHLVCAHMTLHQADVLEYYLKNIAGVLDVKVFDRTCDAVVSFQENRTAVLRAFAAFSFQKAEAIDLVPAHTPRALNREYEDKLAMTVLRRTFSKLFLPLPVRAVISAFRSVKYIREGLKALLCGKLSVAVLDATAVTVSMVRGDFDTAGSVMFMLRLGEILEEWTHKKSVADLAGAMALNVDQVWVKAGETEVLVPVSSVQAGDLVVVRTGNLIALDGKGVEGEAMVNQSSLYAGRHGADVSADEKRHKDAGCSDGRLLVRAQARDAGCGFVCDARGKRVPYFRQRRPFHGSCCEREHRRFRQDRHTHLRHAKGRRYRDLRRL